MTFTVSQQAITLFIFGTWDSLHSRSPVSYIKTTKPVGWQNRQPRRF